MKCRWCGNPIENVIGDGIGFCNFDCYEKSCDADFAYRTYGLESKQLEQVLNR